MHREVTADHKLLSRRLLTKTNRMPRWAERFFPANVAHSVYILEDSIVDPKNRTMTTFTWNINHARLMVGAGGQGCVRGCSPAALTAGVVPAGGGGALRLPGEPGEQQLDRGQAGGLGLFQPLWRLAGCPGECCPRSLLCPATWGGFSAAVSSLSLYPVLFFSHNPHKLSGSPKPPTPSSVTPVRHWGFGQAGTAPRMQPPCMSRGSGLYHHRLFCCRSLVWRGSKAT